MLTNVRLNWHWQYPILESLRWGKPSPRLHAYIRCENVIARARCTKYSFQNIIFTHFSHHFHNFPTCIFFWIEMHKAHAWHIFIRFSWFSLLACWLVSNVTRGWRLFEALCMKIVFLLNLLFKKCKVQNELFKT